MRSLALLLLFGAFSGCCSVSISSSGYQRSCLPNPSSKGRVDPAVHRQQKPQERPAAAWDDDLGVYRVLELGCLWVRLGTYYRLRDAVWLTAPAAEGPWSEVAASELPGRLAQVAACDPETGAVSVAAGGRPRARSQSSDSRGAGPAGERRGAARRREVQSSTSAQ